MATVAEALPGTAEAGRDLAIGQRFVLSGMSWDAYETLLEILGDRPIRATYDRGTLELMSPSAPHEEAGRLFGRLVDIVCEELDLPCLGLRSTTWRRRLQGRGIEADECFYLANTGRILAKKRKIDLDVDPPPDLCIEIEISKSVLDRLGVYAGLGVPELWRYDEVTFQVLGLDAGGRYVALDRSPSLPFLPPEEVVRLIKAAEGIDHTRWSKLVRAWVRDALLPRHRPPDEHPG